MDVTAIRDQPASVVRITGKDRVDLLHRLSTNDLRTLAPGRALTTVFTTPQAKMVDWVLLLAEDDALLARTSTGRAAPLVEWLSRYTFMEDVRYVDVSEGLRAVTVQGPSAAELVGLGSLPGPGVVIQAQGGLWLRGQAALGEERIEGLLPAAASAAFVARARSAGAREAEATFWERLRVLGGVPAAEREFAEPINPLELRLGRSAVAWNKGCYIGQEVIARLDSYDKLARVLMGLKTEAAIVQDGALKIRRGGKNVGRVTSLVPGERDGAVGLCIVDRAAAVPGEVELLSGVGGVAAELVDRPFWQP